MNAEQFQSQLHLYVPTYSVDYWPVWLLLAGLAIVGMLLVLALHAFLRGRLATNKPADHGEKVYLYSKGIRLWHWSNALLFILLLGSGLINHFALLSPPVTASFVAVHKVCGFLLLACWICFVLINAFGGNGHHYLIKRQGWIGRASRQVNFYLFGIMKGEEHPFPATQQSKFNPLQQVAYLGVMYALLPLLLATGLLSLYPEVIGQWAVGIRYWTLQLHFALAVISIFFIFGHLYLCTTGRTPTETFKCMIDGYHRH
ncbi:thiosulfate reductase cytochrome B subunit [Budvicia aquatica]|uniref:Thiosulfate reductase cytochrome B subunit n=1 Tax=Budvicia aquatica TaxID=82979 RepID=A0A2C6DEQ1_9GAMM|nr:thiosulfate reductase cytochrome B subunit [Budvicia aquatica]MBP9643186.1 thiosulfate reductase cytochrome B subunit [Budvicia sp.]PHI29656.1 thiosulfate reductase cytochrome B subunit [Budvicia aquatica]GKX50094.1 thiosulfate reductase cytochrome B [Budvicia aquatica]VFS48028.1 thiosulfate reductase cytochrome B subunit [Budvicia aquatica]